MNTHYIVVDLGYGDAGKGTTVDWLCAQEPKRAVIRFNGGAQAAHNVVTADGRHHTFAQFGSGMLHDGVRTHLSRYMLVNPLALETEAEALKKAGVADAWDRLSVDEYALVTTPFHVAVNRARENARAGARHGSCGQGIGETQAYANTFYDAAIRVRDLQSYSTLINKMDFLIGYYGNEGFAFSGESATAVASRLYEAAETLNIVSGWETSYLLQEGSCVFEGAQGVLLDQDFGWHPHTTWSNTTFGNAEQLLAEAGELEQSVRLGVMRAYMTRHGHGPFVTEDDDLFSEFVEPHNAHGEYQGAWRVGHLDLVAMRYALQVVGGVDGLVVTHLDQAYESEQLGYCASYDYKGDTVRTIPVPKNRAQQAELGRVMMDEVYPNMEHSLHDEDVQDVIERETGVPIVLTSFGPTNEDKVSPVSSLLAATN